MIKLDRFVRTPDADITLTLPRAVFIDGLNRAMAVMPDGGVFEFSNVQAAGKAFGFDPLASMRKYAEQVHVDPDFQVQRSDETDIMDVIRHARRAGMSLDRIIQTILSAGTSQSLFRARQDIMTSVETWEAIEREGMDQYDISEWNREGVSGKVVWSQPNPTLGTMAYAHRGMYRGEQFTVCLWPDRTWSTYGNAPIPNAGSGATLAYLTGLILRGVR